jgi:hypothetical protein
VTQQAIGEDNQGLSLWVSHWSSAVTCLLSWRPDIEKNRFCWTFRQNSWKIHNFRLSFSVLISNLHGLYLNFCDKTFETNLLFDVNNAFFVTSSLYQFSSFKWLPVVWSSRVVQKPVELWKMWFQRKRPPCQSLPLLVVWYWPDVERLQKMLLFTCEGPHKILPCYWRAQYYWRPRGNEGFKLRPA